MKEGAFLGKQMLRGLSTPQLLGYYLRNKLCSPPHQELCTNKQSRYFGLVKASKTNPGGSLVASVDEIRTQIFELTSIGMVEAFEVSCCLILHTLIKKSRGQRPTAAFKQQKRSFLERCSHGVKPESPPQQRHIPAVGASA